MPKDIVICCDGTGNEIATTISNVLKLYRVLEKSEQQRVYYHPGVGTIGLQNAWGRFKQEARGVLGLATGAGLDEDTLAAYRFLCETWEQGDRVWLFGFSRGAYIVRVLAAFIHVMGLLPPDQIDLAGYAFSTYKNPARTPAAPTDHADNSGSGRCLAFQPDRRRIAPSRSSSSGSGTPSPPSSCRRQDNFLLDLQTLRFTRDQSQRQDLPAGDLDRRTPPDVPAQSLDRSTEIPAQSVRRVDARSTRISARSGSPASTPMSAAAIPKIKAPFRNFRCCG